MNSGLGVQSYLELYTLLIGWDLYDKIWNLLTNTGIVFLPFIGIVIDNFNHFYISHGPNDSAEVALRSMEMKLLTCFLLIFFGMVPIISIDAHTISYTPTCNANDGSFHAGDTNTSYDNAFSIPEDAVKVPIWWYMVIAISEGLTNESKQIVACKTDYRKMVAVVNVTQIHDVELKEQIKDFNAMCYLPAKMMYMQDQHGKKAGNLERVSAYQEKFGTSDIDWLGSHALDNVYYSSIQASRLVPGFPYDASTDLNAKQNAANPPRYRMPNCSEWWNDSESGIKARVLSTLDESFRKIYANIFDDEKQKDLLLREVIANSTTNIFQNATNQFSEYGWGRFGAITGIFYSQSTEYPKLYAIQQSAPIIQALLLMIIYICLPFGLVFCSYRPKAFLMASFLIFSVIFWSFLWHLTSMLDSTLMSAFYDGWLAKQATGATMLDFIIGGLVVGFPLFWTGFFSMLGYQLGNMVGTNLAQPIGRIGDIGADGGKEAEQITRKIVN